MTEVTQLFYLRPLDQELRRRNELIQDIINATPENDLINATIEEILAHVTGEILFMPLELYRESASHVTDDVTRYVNGLESPCLRLRVSIPFTGSSDLWNLMPSRRKKEFPLGEIFCEEGDDKGTVTLEVTAPCHTENRAIIKKYEDQLELVNSYIQSQTSDLSNWRDSLFCTVEQLTRLRKERILKRRGLSEMLGIPIKQRPDVPSLPIGLRRRLTRPLPSSPLQDIEEQPGIVEEDYRHILSVIRHESRTFETIPSTLAKLDEEDLRSILLVHLNGHYEGAATGETFRGCGKTDIRIEDKGRSAFVAECKIWTGRQGLLNAIDQLLGYLTWRDCKTALIIFNKRNKDLSRIKDELVRAFRDHDSFQRNIPLDGDQGEGEWEFSMASRQDSDRLIRIHVFLFNCNCNENSAGSPGESAPTHPSPPSTPPPDPAPTSPAPPGLPRRDL
jgi:hypothetical protein